MTMTRWLLPLALLSLMTGCEDGATPKSKSKTAKAPIKTRQTIGQKTQEVRRLSRELGQGAEVTDRKIKAKDYITLQAEAYRTAVGNLGMNNVNHAIRLYEAEHGDKPKTYEEFMEHVLKKGQPDGIWLPMLPFYQEYAYDEENKQLVVIEYPEIKAQHQREQDERFGRR